MKHIDRLLGKVNEHFWKTVSFENWKSVETMKFWGTVEEKESDGKFGVARLHCYQNDHDPYDVNGEYEIKLPVDSFPMKDEEVEENLFFELIITDYENFKKGASESETIQELPDSTYTVSFKISKTSSM